MNSNMKLEDLKQSQTRIRNLYKNHVIDETDKSKDSDDEAEEDVKEIEEIILD